MELKTFIEQKYKETCQEGKKVQCPMCKHETFFMKNDGTVAKCFHPSCGWFITQGAIDPRPSTHKLLENLLNEWHADLVNPKTLHQKTAYEYLTKERRISPGTIEKASIGVVPETTGIAEKVIKMVMWIHESGAEINPDGESDSFVDWITTKGRELDELCRKLHGWLAFFYVDSAGKFCAIHFRQPGTKKFATFKPKKNMGLFGLNMFTPSVRKDNPGLNEIGLVVEGEFDCLKIQSTLADCGYDFVNCAAVGGAQTADMQTIKQAIPKPVVIMDNDEAGQKMVDRISAEMHIEVGKPPAAFKDIDQFLNTFDFKYRFDALGVLKKLISERTPILQPLENVKTRINAIRLGYDPEKCNFVDGKPQKMRMFEINQRISEIIIEDMSRRGAFYHENSSAYYLHKETNNLIALEKDGIDVNCFLSKYALNPTEKTCSYVLDQITIHALENGTKTTISNFSTVKVTNTTHTLYLAMNNNRMLKVQSDGIHVKDNGQDGILFLSSSNTIPVMDAQYIDAAGNFCEDDPCGGCGEPLENCECEYGRNLAQIMDQHLLNNILLKRFSLAVDRLDEKQVQFLVKCWMMSFIFRDLLPSRPILAMIGPKGSGKTTALRLCGKTLCGENWDVAPVSSDEKDFDSTITSKPLLGLDNVDGRIKWLNDKLAVVATGGKLEKRILHTTNQHKEFPIITTIALTSRTPMFRRDDVAERLQIIEFERIDEREGYGFECEYDILREVITKRKEIWQEIIPLAMKIIWVLDEDEISEIRVPDARMQDFARFMIIVGRALKCEELAYQICSEQRTIQDNFTLENETLVDLLLDWLEIKGNEGREVLCATLNDELAKMAEQRNRRWGYESTSSLAQKLRHIKPNLSAVVEMQSRIGSGRMIRYKFFKLNKVLVGSR